MHEGSNRLENEVERMLKFIATRLQYKLIVAFVLILTVPVIVLGAINIPSTYNQLVSRSLESALADNQVQAQAIAYTLKRAEPDAIYLVQTPALQAYGSHIILAGATDLDSTLLSVADSLRAYLRNAPEYDSLALLDTKRHEVVRIRYYSGVTAIVVQSLLQDRSQTDYFKVALALKPGEVYASPVALNVEDDLIERPFLPIVHFSTPLYASNGQLMRIVV